MIISYQHKFIFVAIPKTASHSFRVALRPHLGSNDWEQCHLLVEKAFPVENIARLKHGHISCTQIQPCLIPGIWNQYFKFCTVRNPYDRFISHCHFIHREDKNMQHNALPVMKGIIENPTPAFQPQHHYVVNNDGAILVDHVAKFEDLQEHFNQICKHIDLPEIPLEHINPAERPPYQECFDQELLEMVQDLYAKDFVLFDYPLALV